MNNTTGHVSSQILVDLQHNLHRLAESLDNLSKVLRTSLDQAQEAGWEDGKFNEFAAAFEEPLRKIGEMSARNREFADKTVEKVKQAAIAYEERSVNI